MALCHDVLHGRHQIVRLVFLDLEVHVAGYPERMRTDDRESGKQQIEVGRDSLFEPDEVMALRLDKAEVLVAPGLLLARDRKQPAEGVRHLEPCEAPPPNGVVDLDGEVEAQVRDVRKRMSRVEGERREDRRNLVHEVAAE